MVILLKCYSNNAEFNGDADCALASIDPVIARRVLDRINALKLISTEESPATQIYYRDAWKDGLTNFFTPYISGDTANELISDELEELCNGAAHDGYLILTGKTAADKIPYKCIANTEMWQMIVESTGIRYFCYPRHSNTEITTEEITLDILWRAAGEGN